jgi:hypothetical protein
MVNPLFSIKWSSHMSKVIADAKKALNSATEFKKDVEEQLKVYYTTYQRGRDDQIVAREQNWDNDQKDLEKLIDTMQKVGEFWYGNLYDGMEGYGGQQKSVIDRAESILRTMQKRIADVQKKSG